MKTGLKAGIVMVPVSAQLCITWAELVAGSPALALTPVSYNAPVIHYLTSIHYLRQWLRTSHLWTIEFPR